MTTIGIVGSRRRDTERDYEIVKAALLELLKDKTRRQVMLVSGGCPRGADRFAERLAKELGLSILVHYPDWDGLGKRAGFERNTYIAEDADVLIACVAPDRKGGTEDTVRKFQKLKTKASIILC